ncbi:hypothetical protein BV25DRAFT_1705798 [Artomyces pyxidatus]|uniref:Uncharacterized protein n=1 Tax=Artomyces pyxidatus TaxID=48021 RepID=A0ACB8T9F6_9AGAM|nr:hypothetical protein BV25DRAFT_1705798 [Artomyces pyxidatus]
MAVPEGNRREGDRTRVAGSRGRTRPSCRAATRACPASPATPALPARRRAPRNATTVTPTARAQSSPQLAARPRPSRSLSIPRAPSSAPPSTRPPASSTRSPPPPRPQTQSTRPSPPPQSQPSSPRSPRSRSSRSRSPPSASSAPRPCPHPPPTRPRPHHPRPRICPHPRLRPRPTRARARARCSSPPCRTPRPPPPPLRATRPSRPPSSAAGTPTSSQNPQRPPCAANQYPPRATPSIPSIPSISHKYALAFAACLCTVPLLCRHLFPGHLSFFFGCRVVYIHALTWYPLALHRLASSNTIVLCTCTHAACRIVLSHFMLIHARHDGRRRCPSPASRRSSASRSRCVMAHR